jgi:hypothetical protein
MDYIKKAKEILAKKGADFTVSYMTENDCEDFIWSFLYDNHLQYEFFEYIENGNKMCAIIYERL